MMFLAWWNPASWLNDAKEGFLGMLAGGLRYLFYFLSEHIYKIMIDLYNLFDALSHGRLLDNTILNVLAARVGLILGLVMLFYVVLSFIQMLVDPDKITDSKGNGAVNVIKKVILTIVMLGVSSFAFETLYYVQTVIINNHVIPKLIIPYEIDNDSFSKFGNILSSELFTSFYRVRDFDEETKANDYNIEICQRSIYTLKDNIYEKEDFDVGNDCLNTGTTILSGEGERQIFIMDFNWIFMIGVGIVICYLLLSYCIAIGVRMIRLAILEIISPMAIVSYLSPKQDNMFNKWIKLYFNTYLDVFIRILIINFVVFLIATILDTEGSWTFWSTVSGDKMEVTITAVMIVALLTFAKKVPDFLKELGFDGGQFGGFHIKDALGLSAGIGVAGMGVGTVLGATANSAIGAIDRGRMAHKLGKSPLGVAGAALSGVGSGFARGLRYGIQNKGDIRKNIPAGFKAQHESDLSYEQLISGGGNARGKLWSGVSSHFGETKGQGYQRMISDLDRIDDYKKQMYAAADEAHAVKAAKDTWEQMHQTAGESNADYEARKQDAYDRYKSLRNDFVDNAMSGNKSYAGGVMDDDDLRQATDVKSVLAQANSFSLAHNVKRWDATANGGEGGYVNIGTIDTRDALAKASNYAHETKTHIASQEDYASSIANDAAAGVNGKRKFGPPGGK